MKKIILLLVFIFIDMHPCQKIIDCNGKQFLVQAHVHKMLKKQCETYREHLLDSVIKRNPRTVDFSDGQPFLKHSTLECLISCLHSPQAIESIRDPKKLLALTAAAEYLQAPKDFMRKLWLYGNGKFNHPDLKHYEPECIILGNQLFSFGEYIQEQYAPPTKKQEPGPTDYSPIFYGKEIFKVQSLHGLGRIFDIVECASLQRLNISFQNLTDFNLKEFARLMPHLKFLSLARNKIRILKRQHLEGMPPHFYLSLEGNPITSIEKGCLTNEIIRHAAGSTIQLSGTKLASQEFERLADQWSLHNDDATFAVFFTHLLAASFGPACAAMVPAFLRDLDHVQKCRQLDFIDGSVIISAALFSTLYLMYCFNIGQKKNENYAPESITFKTADKEYQYYNDSFARHFWEFFKFSVGASAKKNLS